MIKYIRFIFIVLIAVSLVYFFFLANQGIKEDKTNNTNQQEQADINSLEVKTDERGQITVKITPQTLSGDQWKFDVALDTHSVELDQDFLRIAELVDSRGNVYKPVAWEGAGPGGHHREGALVFEGVNPASDFVELKIKDVGGVSERVFKWNLK